MKNKIQYIPLSFFGVNILIYLIFHFIFKYNMNRKLYYDFHTSITPMLILLNIFVSIMFFIILYSKKEYAKMYYTLYPILIYIILFVVLLFISFK